VLALIAGASLFLRPLQNLGAVVAVVSLFWVGGVLEISKRSSNEIGTGDGS